jgi:hypothetical protein
LKSLLEEEIPKEIIKAITAQKFLNINIIRIELKE